MKITKAENYKKPRYALGVTAALMAVSMTGCGNPVPGIDYAGDIQMDPGYVEYDGGIQMDPGYIDEVQLSGDVAMPVEYTIENTGYEKDTEYNAPESKNPEDITSEYIEYTEDELVLDGGVSIDVSGN